VRSRSVHRIPDLHQQSISTGLLPRPSEGRDLNPLLRTRWMIAHPPMLYLGYVGFCVPSAFAIPRAARRAHRCALVGWTTAMDDLCLGIPHHRHRRSDRGGQLRARLGGWWFWDPVENASFMRGCAGTALRHAQAVTEKARQLPRWTLLLAIAAFSLSLLGTFLVRSGVLTSVLAFAADPTRGLFILVFLGWSSAVRSAASHCAREGNDGAPFATLVA
jgi:cytochrome c-type biogenesis protein CcmF